MVKTILKVFGILLGFVAIFGVIDTYYFPPDNQFVLDFIKENPNKSAIKLIRNDKLVVERNSNEMMPLASTVKIIVAIEYAIQSSRGMINPDEEILLEEVEKFYVPNTDLGAHSRWLNSIKNKIKNKSISIREIAKGMIRNSSNANTEWLSRKLELKNINERIDSLEITAHSDMYYFVSSLFVGKEKYPELKGKELKDKLQKLSIEEYINVTNKIHLKLVTDETYKSEIGDFRMNIQRCWSDNLPGSTVNEYAELMGKLNSKKYFDSDTYIYLDEVMEGDMQNPANQKWLEHSGKKGGRTAFVLTKALYATDKKGNKTELAYFFDDLEVIENRKLRESMNGFERSILTSEHFRTKIKDVLK